MSQKIHIHPRGEYLTLHIDISKYDLILLSSDSVPINTNIMAIITTIFTHFRANLAYRLSVISFKCTSTLVQNKYSSVHPHCASSAHVASVNKTSSKIDGAGIIPGR